MNRKFHFISNQAPHHYRVIEILDKGQSLVMGSIRLWNDNWGTLHKFTPGKWYFISAFDVKDQLTLKSDTLEEIKTKVIKELSREYDR